MSGNNSRGRRSRIHRLMLFGGGGAGTAIARAAQASGRAEVVAICEPNPDRRAELEQEFTSAAISDDYEELLRTTSPTIADVASPDHLHTEHAIAALEAGCDVLVEKPLAVTVDDAVRTVETAERENATLVVNYTLRFQYPTQEALQYALDGKLGEPFLYQGYYVHDLWEMYSTQGERHTPWRVDAHNPQNVLLGGGCHPIDLILTAADSPPVEVSAYANGLAGSGLPVDDCYTVNIAFESGAVANVLVTTGVNGVSFTPGYFNVYGTDGTILKDTLYRRGADPEKLERMTPELDGGHNWQSAFEGFVDAVNGFLPTPVPLDIALLNVAVCEAAIQSVETGKPVKPRIIETRKPWGDLETAQLMLRYSKGLADLPEWEAPPGFELRRYDPSYDDRIRDVLRAVGFEHAAGDFYDYELMPRKELKEGTHIVVHNDEVVGVTFAGVVDATEGRLDYVAADPRFSGKGIGWAVCAGVVRHLLEQGYKTAVLWTDDWRLPAIVTYMKVGFEPVMYREDMERRWEGVHARLARNRSRMAR